MKNLQNVIKTNKKDKICLITNDVETTNIQENCLDDSIIELIFNNGMPLLIDIYDQLNIKTTFFFTGHIAKKKPEIVKMILKNGHEVGSHGLTHEVDKAFDLLSLEDQIFHLKESKKILEDISGQEVISFRAPALRVNKNTALALAETGFKIDSSIASQRFDFFMSFGGVKKLKWLFAPRLPYRVNKNNLYRKGNSVITEIPISALFVPYICTTLRIFPHLTKLIRRILHLESLINQKPIVFLTHPNEFISTEKKQNKVYRRSNNILSYLFADLLRRKLKSNNLGKEASNLLYKELSFFRKNNYKFHTLKEYYENKVCYKDNKDD